MIYPDNFEEKIGFNEIRTMLKGRCLSELGVECINKMEVLYEGDEIRERLEQVKEYVLRAHISKSLKFLTSSVRSQPFQIL